MTRTYLYIWEYQVSPDQRPEFEQHYGSAGSRVSLFRVAEGYIDTILLHDRSDEGRYITMDRWRDESSYQAFRIDYANQYLQLDKQCEHLTNSEMFLGAFYE